MESRVLGLHHVTAITGDPQHNLNFYTGILGLRFVKRTVNFDVPDTYHLYYGDDIGHPGTILTFFSWPDSPGGLRGKGQISTIAFSIPLSALGFWQERLTKQGIAVTRPVERFDEQVLIFTDHEGLALELVAHAGAEQRKGWQDGPVPAEYAVRGLHSITLSVARREPTETLLIEGLGFQRGHEMEKRVRYTVGGAGALVDVLEQPDLQDGLEAIGTVHHVAWRTANDERQLEWRNRLLSMGQRVTAVMDRTYFHSIYFREPGGILFEIATDLPGFPVDEPPEQLGTHLKLPPWLESRRPTLERNLPPIHIPESVE
jgi:glyoxalase family protein